MEKVLTRSLWVHFFGCLYHSNGTKIQLDAALGTKERYYRDPKSRNQYQKRKYQENPKQEKDCKKNEILGKS